MGDRGNVRLKQPNGQSIWLYTHWLGSDIPSLVQAGLRLGRHSVNDAPYLNRCIITEFTKQASGEGGFGVGLDPGDNEHDIIEVDLEAGKVRVRSRERYLGNELTWNPDKAAILGEWTIVEFRNLPEEKLPEV